MCKDYYTLQFMDPSIDTSPIAPALQVRRGMCEPGYIDTGGLVVDCLAPHTSAPIRAGGLNSCATAAIITAQYCVVCTQGCQRW